MTGPLPDESFPFRVSARALREEVLLVASGEFDVACGPSVAAALAEAVTPTCRRVVIEAGAVTFIDCAGLRALLAPPPGWEGEWEVVLRAPSPRVKRLVELARNGGLLEARCLRDEEGTPCLLASGDSALTVGSE